MYLQSDPGEGSSATHSRHPCFHGNRLCSYETAAFQIMGLKPSVVVRICVIYIYIYIYISVLGLFFNGLSGAHAAVGVLVFVVAAAGIGAVILAATTVVLVFTSATSAGTVVDDGDDNDVV